MNNNPNPFNMFGQTMQQQMSSQNQNYPINNNPFQNSTQNYQPPNMNYSPTTHNNSHSNQYGGYVDMSHNSFINHHSANNKKH